MTLVLDRCVVGDCRTILPTLPAGVFRTCVTSPPYWGLRDYGVDGQLGLEETPEAYVAGMVAVFREVRRVLADDGTAWVNLGDSYATFAGAVGECPGGGAQGQKWRGDGMPNRNGRGEPMRTRADRDPRHAGKNTAIGPMTQPNRKSVAGLKPKDLVGIPWRVAFALQADGWYLRSDIIWAKPNPMPESVTDRPTKAHEYVFLLSKSARYFYDADAIREPVSHWTVDRAGQGSGTARHADHAKSHRADGADRVGPGSARWGRDYRRDVENGRNRRTVWTIPTEPYSGSHFAFATFPRALVTPCVLAGSALGDAVLDPFFGSGTVGQVAESLGRRWFGCELSPAYAELSAARTAQTGLPFGRPE